LKILHIDPETAFGGGERQVLGLIRHLARRGHENLLAAAPGSRLSMMVPAADARLIPLNIHNHVDLVAALSLRRIVARESPHVIHYHTSRVHALAPWLRRYAPRALVTRRMDYPIRRGWWSDLLYNRSVGAVVAISEEVRRVLVAGGVRPERLRVIPSGVEPPAGLPGSAGRDAARRRFVADDDAVIVVVAALERRKGHDVLLEALRRLVERGVRFRCLLCGDGSERASLERQAAELGLGGRVVFLGEQRQVADVLAAADLFVLPSRYEGLGVAILEAMAMALPVVATRVGGIPEAVEDGRTGWLVPAEDDTALADAMAKLIAAPEHARDLGRCGRERILERFAMAHTAEAYERLYEELNRVA
jgi:glycosyltransferase involved in cell wall biosynthesis